MAESQGVEVLVGHAASGAKCLPCHFGALLAASTQDEKWLPACLRRSGCQCHARFNTAIHKLLYRASCLRYNSYGLCEMSSEHLTVFEVVDDMVHTEGVWTWNV